MAPKWLQAWRHKRSSRSPSPSGGTRQDTLPHPAPPQPGPSSSAPAPIAPEPQASPAVPSVAAPKDPIRTRIWNSAYDKVKEDEPRLVEAYEKILSVQLGDDNPAPLDGASTNVINQDAGARQDQMKQLVDKGLQKTEREAKVKEKIKEGMQPIKNIKDFVALAFKSEPTAAVAWVGITTFMEIITNPVTEPGINRDGIKHVLETVQWYWELSDLLDADGADESTIKLQELLEKHIANLYKKLLVYQMQSVCLYNKYWVEVLFRDFVKIDDWQEKVDSIKKAEEAIREKIKQKNSEVLKSRLACIDNKLGHLRLDVQAVTSAVGRVESAVNEQTRGLLKIHYDDKDNECLRDLCIINPQTHKKQLEKTKGGLLKDSYRWILDNDDFRGFRIDSDRRLLWIKGDPGKGKTMLLCGIIDELEKESTQPLSYFFCQATQDYLRSAISVLRGLVWLLCKKHPELMPCVREAYDMEGKKCFEDFFSLKGILENMLKEPCLKTAILIVDALDECSYQRDDVVEREELIDLIIELSEAFSAKWIVSSRNWPVIKGQFRPAEKIVVSLELNKTSISQAVETFVRYKTDELARTKPYDEGLKEAVLERLLAGANDTFLWVALVCKELARPVVEPWETLDKLGHLCTGLDGLYKRMLEQIVASRYSDLCRQILAIACVAYRPLSLDELRTLVPKLQAYGSKALKDLIGECGSFLTLQEDTIYFVHQSAQDFLVGKGKESIFPFGISEQHRVLFRRSLEALKVLHRDIYGLKSPGVSVKDITPQDPNPLSRLKYAILYWIDHLGQLQGRRDTSDDELIDKFFREKYLYWIEALSLQNFIDQGLNRIQRLKEIICHTHVEGLEYLVEDARQFVLSYLHIIEEAPLQLYASALLFSPTRSVIRQLFKHEEPSWLIRKPRAAPGWSACVLSLKMHHDFIMPHRVYISCDGKLLARTHGEVVQIFNPGWGHATHSITTSAWLTNVEFSPNGERLAMGVKRAAIELWDIKSGRRIRGSIDDKEDITALTFSPNGKLLASALTKHIILWDPDTCRRLQTIDCELQNSMSFSANSQQLASGSSYAGEIRVWDVATGDCIWSIEAHSSSVDSLAFISGDVLVSCSSDTTVKIWDLTDRVCTQTLATDCRYPSLVPLRDGRRFAYSSGSNGGTVNICNERGACLRTIIIDRGSRLSMFLPGPQLLATTSSGGFKLWDLASMPSEQVDKRRNRTPSQLALSCDGRYLASRSEDGTLSLWDTSDGTYRQTFEYVLVGDIGLLTFSENGQLLISQSRSYLVSGSYLVQVWDAANGNCLGTYKYCRKATFSPDGQQLAFISTDNIIMVYHLPTGNCIWKIEADTKKYPFLVNGNRLVLASGNNIEVWDIPRLRSIASLASVEVEAGDIESIVLSNDSSILVVSGSKRMGSYGYTHPVWVWDLASQELLRELEDSVSPTISSDNELMAYCFQYGINVFVEILKLKTGTLLHRLLLPHPKSPLKLQFDPIKPFLLHTKRGDIDLANRLCDVGVNIESTLGQPHLAFQYFGNGLSGDRAWILNGSTRILWLPPEYRKNVLVMGSTVAIAHQDSGRVSVIQFAEDGQNEDGR